MALTPEKIDEIAGPADYFDRRVFARAIESEVRKQDTELIRQMLESMCWAARVMTISEDEAPGYFAAITAGRARLEGKL